MRNKIFVDSDVVIDFFTDRAPFANQASILFDLNEQKKVQIYLSAVSINNIYYIVRKYLGHKSTLKVVEELVDITQIISTSKNEIAQALRNNFKDFEDSIQYSTALTIKGVTAIITRNVKDYVHSEIAVFTPDTFLKTIENESKP